MSVRDKSTLTTHAIQQVTFLTLMAEHITLVFIFLNTDGRMYTSVFRFHALSVVVCLQLVWSL